MKRIFSLNLICFLRVSGIKEKDVGIDGKTGNVFYLFEDNQKLVNLIDEYKSEGTQVVLKSFIGEYKILKDEIAKYKRSYV